MDLIRFVYFSFNRKEDCLFCNSDINYARKSKTKKRRKLSNNSKNSNSNDNDEGDSDKRDRPLKSAEIICIFEFCYEWWQLRE